MSTLVLAAPAKLNLFLRVTGRRPDGYHNLQTVFQLLDYGDSLSFDNCAGNGLQFTCSDPALASKDNLVLKAARLLQACLPRPSGCRIHLDKRLPVGGGLGGGSSDAATTLLGLNKLWNCGLGLAELAALGLQLGADVPVFVHGKSAWAEGIGEVLEPLMLPRDWFVVVTPPVLVETRRVFTHPELTRDSTPLRIRAFPFSGAKNDCESVTCLLYPEVRNALDWLASKASGAAMTGTGSSVFARFATREQAAAVLAVVPERYTGFMAQGINVSPAHQALNLQNVN